MESEASLAQLEETARQIRVEVVRMVARSTGHLGGAFSMAEMIAALYFRVLRIDPANPAWDGRDYFILSKGHATPGLHAALAMRGFFPREWLETSKKLGSRLSGHASTLVPGIDVSTGSMGHGLPVALGIALGVKADRAPNRVFCLLGDGEMQEGSNWEAIMAAGHHRADNLIAIVDRNIYQACGATEDLLSIEPLEAKFTSFGWAARRIDGHHMPQVVDALEAVPFEPGKPSAIISDTMKGKGCSFMEGVQSHFVSLTREQELAALRELGEAV